MSKSRLEELFLGRERVVTLINGKSMKVRQWPGTDIFIALDGSFVMPRWQGEEEGETPHQRRQKKWSPKELGYMVYPRGLSSALRSRQLAIYQVQKISQTTYQEALTVFEDEVRGVIIEEKTMDPRKLSPALRAKLQQFGFVFQRAQKPGVKEAMVKILFLYQDEEQGLNVGAMLARTVAITDRLRDRLLGIYSWTRKYSAQEKALSMIRELVDKITGEALAQMKLIRWSSAVIRGQGNKVEQRVIADRLVTLSMSMEPLKAIRPFSRWMAFVMEDFNEMLLAIKNNDFVLTRALIERVMFSVRLKSLQKNIDRLLLRLGQDRIVRVLRWSDYGPWAESLSASLCRLAMEEARVGLREKVCLAAAQALREAAQEADNLRRLSHFKAAVKRAYALL